MVKKEPEIKRYVKEFKRIDYVGLFFVIALSLILFGIITGLFSAGMYFAGTVYSFPFICTGIGVVLLSIAILSTLIPSLVINDEISYREEDFDRIDSF